LTYPATKEFSSKNINHGKLEGVEENIVAVALKTILINASWLFPTKKDYRVRYDSAEAR
jgi:hypothetical protein